MIYTAGEQVEARLDSTADVCMYGELRSTYFRFTTRFSHFGQIYRVTCDTLKDESIWQDEALELMFKSRNSHFQ